MRRSLSCRFSLRPARAARAHADASDAGISRVWLRWIPRTVREPLSAYFDPPQSVHPNLPDPNEIEIEDDAERREKIAASSLRILLSAAHGLHDLEHYLLRFFIAFVVALLKTLALLALIAGITIL